MNQGRDVDHRLEAWFAAERTRKAPETVLRGASDRISSIEQRRIARWLGQRWPTPGMPRHVRAAAAPLGLAGAVGVLLLAVSLLPAAGPSLTGGPTPGSLTTPSPTPSPTPLLARTPRPSPTLSPNAIRIVFAVTDGIYGFELRALKSSLLVTPPPKLQGTGTFTMSGAFAADGTFTDDISFTPDGTFSVTRRLQAPTGELDARATVLTHESDIRVNDGVITTAGTWQITGGTGPWSAVAAHGTLSGALLTSSETWDGTVGP